MSSDIHISVLTVIMAAILKIKIVATIVWSYHSIEAFKSCSRKGMEANYSAITSGERSMLATIALAVNAIR